MTTTEPVAGATPEECCPDCRWSDYDCRGDCPCHWHEPDHCYICHGHILPDEESKVVTVDADPGDPEVGPQPDICDVIVHTTCWDMSPTKRPAPEEA